MGGLGWQGGGAPTTELAPSTTYCVRVPKQLLEMTNGAISGKSSALFYPFAPRESSNGPKQTAFAGNRGFSFSQNRPVPSLKSAELC